MSNSSPLLMILLIIIGVLNLIPYIIYLCYKRRLCYRRLLQQERRNSDEHIQSHPDILMFNKEQTANDDDDVPEMTAASLSSSENYSDDESEILCHDDHDVENGSDLAKEKARNFVAKQEQMLIAARSRWGVRRGYGVLSSAPNTNAT